MISGHLRINALRHITQTQPASSYRAMDYLQALPKSIVTKFQILNPFILTGVATLVFWLILSFCNSGAWKVGYGSATLDGL